VKSPSRDRRTTVAISRGGINEGPNSVSISEAHECSDSPLLPSCQSRARQPGETRREKRPGNK